ncbi:flagellar assembly peptidoglycan hydrolase FlgJ [Comamonas sp. NLF-1-9]|uniref:flagellar assembly peptidoglycan hydrolase FlgJ n=1 Tax=Comamonas sp. NLF-1-9 TaxID=2853163 RepID=UPI001C43C0E6|nr:flagellar assembly peptidoglycan hydrolase FlgJ [Comamonas sp. NLF-1-9]QXL84246.1 flagellar assembly peptidoglycan hydrolase FlgJ [Comamonas sp. NLF-1-9]
MAITSSGIGAAAGLAVDGRGLEALKLQASAGDAQAQRAATAQAARQLESLFMRELLKSMRESTRQLNPDSGNEGGLATDLFDQQMSVQMAGQPGGLAQMIERELTRQLGASAAASAPVAAMLPKSTFSFAGAGAPASPQSFVPSRGQGEFVQQHRAAAQAVARESGIPAAFMLGQAGHETGWGRSAIRTADGGNSHNLFGIKATGGWQGKVAEVTTTEYIDGTPRKLVARFRAYDSYEESFRDYARLITQNPRYEKALAKVDSVQGWAAELQRAGYATDPNYASKLSRAIQSTMALARPAAGTQA